MYFKIKNLSLLRNWLILCSLSAIGLLLAGGCHKDELTKSGAIHLQYSEDTLQFDTVLTQLSTITNCFKIYNRSSDGIQIETIQFASGSAAQFVLNVNGKSGTSINNVTVRAGDSVFVFVQALLGKNGHDSLQVHADAIEVLYNGNTDRMPVTAFGLDAEKQKAQIITQNTVWSTDKGYLIFDSLVIAKNTTLRIEAGAKLFFYGKANMVIYGTLIINGTPDNPVTFNSHRLDSSYQNRYGQWGSVLFKAGSRGNQLNSVCIKNGTTGISLASDPNGQIDITLNGCDIENMTYAAVYARNAHITATNCVFANSSKNVLRLIEGGWYDFKHISVANYGTRNQQMPIIYVNNYRDAKSTIVPLQNFTLINSIVYGSQKAELQFDHGGDAASFVAHISNCFLRQDVSTNNLQDTMAIEQWIDSAVYRVKPSVSPHLFIDSINNFEIDTLSEARNKANIEISKQLPIDKKGNNRLADGKPDLGAYEFVSEKR